jgi:spermidine/putrescine transport system substrate-binding protein
VRSSNPATAQGWRVRELDESRSFHEPFPCGARAHGKEGDRVSQEVNHESGPELRRVDFLKYAALFVGTGVAAGCGASSKSEGGAAPTTTKVDRPPVEKEPGDLVVFDWAGYELPELWAEYRQQYPDQKPKFTFLTGSPQAFSKVRAGFSPDLTHPCNAYIQNFVDLGVMQPFDTSRLSHFGELNPSMVKTGQVNGQQFYIPTDWGLNAPMYRADKVDPKEQSWNILYDERYAGKIVWHDHTDNLVINGWVHGFTNANDMDDEQLAVVKADLIEKKNVVRNIVSSETELASVLAAGDAWIGYASASGWTEAKKKGLDVVHMDPKEGRQAYNCGFLLSKETKNYYHAHDYVNAWSSGDAGQWLIENYGLGHTNTSVDLSKIDPLTVTAYQLDNPAALATANFDKPLPRLKEYSKIWDEIKAA